MRLPVEAMIAFIEGHRLAYWGEPIFRVLPIAPSTCHEHVAGRRPSTRRPACAWHGEARRPKERRVFAKNFRLPC